MLHITTITYACMRASAKVRVGGAAGAQYSTAVLTV